MIEKSVNFVQKIAWIETVADKSQCVECKPDYYKSGDECFDGYYVTSIYPWYALCSIRINMIKTFVYKLKMVSKQIFNNPNFTANIIVN